MLVKGAMSVGRFLIGDTSQTNTVGTIGNIIDNLHTSTQEKIDGEVRLMQVSNSLIKLQAEITKQEASHRSVFVAGWRPAVGWTCCIQIIFENLIVPLTGIIVNPATINVESLLLALIGLRSYEKIKGKAR